MLVVCSYCGDELGDKPPLEDGRVTHSICPSCEAHFRRQWDGITLGEYLDAFHRPVIVVDGDGRLVAANNKMAEMRDVAAPSALVGLLGGDAMECAYARLPGGCGQTEHCHTCGIRLAVQHTIDSGEPVQHRRVYLDRVDGRVYLYISTWPRDGMVVVTVAPA